MSARPPTIKKPPGNGSKPTTPPADKNATTPPSSAASSSKKLALAAKAKGTVVDAIPTEVFAVNNETDLRSETGDATAQKQYAFNEYFAGRDTAKRVRPPDQPGSTKLWNVLELVLNLVRWILYTLYEALCGSSNASNAAAATKEKK